MFFLLFFFWFELKYFHARLKRKKNQSFFFFFFFGATLVYRINRVLLRTNPRSFSITRVIRSQAGDGMGWEGNGMGVSLHGKKEFPAPWRTRSSFGKFTASGYTVCMRIASDISILNARSWWHWVDIPYTTLQNMYIHTYTMYIRCP